MNWAEYKRLCDAPEVMSRHLLETSARILEEGGEQALALTLRKLSAQAPLARPPDHRGDVRSHMFMVWFSQANTDQILRILDASEAPGIKAIRAAWLEYRLSPACQSAS